MTHTLHRKGTEKDLKKDFVIMAMLAAGINDNYDDTRVKMIKIGEIMNGHKILRV
jgi:hypothetical protein